MLGAPNYAWLRIVGSGRLVYRLKFGYYTATLSRFRHNVVHAVLEVCRLFWHRPFRQGVFLKI